MTAADLKKHFHKGKANAYAWPGGYPLFYLASDGETFCPSCVTKERVRIFRSTHENDRDGFAIAGVDINWEDASMYCCHCNAWIESAYAEDDAKV
jgi:hypothetical protein